MLNITEYTQKSEELIEKTRKIFLKAGKKLDITKNESDSISIVFAGQYSAGKSSILKMLTGREDIGIGAGITTQRANVYDWKGIKIIDTPGIHTEIRPDHDEISYKAIMDADMLVFVVTNELFDFHMADHFRKLAIDRDKAREMILVINKMERATEGNTESQQDIIKEDLKKVLSPYTPEELHISFLDAESYLDSIEERESDAEFADELVKRSGYNKFVDTLNQFVEEKNISSKLTTELYQVDEQLDIVIKDLQPKSIDSDIEGLEENYMQQRGVLFASRIDIHQTVKDIYTLSASKIRNIGLDAANLITEGCKKDEVEFELEKLVSQTESIVDKCQNEAMKVIVDKLEYTENRIEELENSEFSRKLKVNLNNKFDKLPEEIKKILTHVGSGFQKTGKVVMDNAYKTGVKGGLKLTNFSGSNIHEMVLKVGHVIGHKFKPWEAIKITKGIAIGSQILSIFGIGISIFMQIQSDQEEEKIREELRKNRQSVRSQFNAVAKDLEDFGRNYIKDNIDKPFEKSIADIEENIQQIRNTRSNRSSICKDMESLQKECRYLIQDIHSDN